MFAHVHDQGNNFGVVRAVHDTAKLQPLRYHMESGVTELRFSFHCGFKAFVYTTGDMRSLELLGKVIVQLRLTQSKLVLIKDCHYTFCAEEIGSLLKSAVTMHHVFQNCIINVLFGLERKMNLWIGSHGGMETQMFATLLKCLNPTAPEVQLYLLGR